MIRLSGIKRSLIGDVHYALDYNDGSKPEFENADIVKIKWPNKLANFLEGIIRFVIVHGPLRNPIREAGDADGPTNRIIGCSEIGRTITYLCEWVNGATKLVESSEAKAQFENLVIEYLENNLA